MRKLYSITLGEALWHIMSILTFLPGYFIDAEINIALNKPANQSSTHGSLGKSYTADIAVDGDPVPAQCMNLNAEDGLWTYPECGLDGQGEWECWWRVDLGKIYYIYDVTVCNETRLDGAQLLFSIEESNMPEKPDPKDTTNWKVVETISVNSSATNLISIPEQSVEMSVARHVAIFKPENSSMGSGISLREVTVTGFSEEEKSAISLHHKEEITLSNFTISTNIGLTGFNSTVFALSILTLYQCITDDKRTKLGDILVRDGTEELHVTLSNLMPGTGNLSFEIELTSRQFSLATSSFQVTMPKCVSEIDDAGITLSIAKLVLVCSGVAIFSIVVTSLIAACIFGNRAGRTQPDLRVRVNTMEMQSNDYDNIDTQQEKEMDSVYETPEVDTVVYETPDQNSSEPHEYITIKP